MSAFLELGGRKVTLQNEDVSIITDPRMPEIRLAMAIMENAFREWNRFLDQLSRKPLKQIEKRHYELLHAWLFIDSEEYGSLSGLAAYISDCPELLVEKVRHIAIHDPKKLIIWIKERPQYRADYRPHG